MRRVFLTVLLALCCGSSHASFETQSVQLHLEGFISPECSLSGVQNEISLGDIRQAGQQDLQFSLSCNAPFSYQLSSLNGGLRHEAASEAPSGFLVTMPYQVNMRVPTQQGGLIDDTCASSTLSVGAVTCAFSNSGSDIAINQNAQLSFSWVPGSLQPVAGSYHDELTLTVFVQP